MSIVRFLSLTLAPIIWYQCIPPVPENPFISSLFQRMYIVFNPLSSYLSGRSIRYRGMLVNLYGKYVWVIWRFQPEVLCRWLCARWISWHWFHSFFSYIHKSLHQKEWRTVLYTQCPKSWSRQRRTLLISVTIDDYECICIHGRSLCHFYIWHTDAGTAIRLMGYWFIAPVSLGWK